MSLEPAAIVAALSHGQRLTEVEAGELATAMLRKELGPAQCGAALAALRVRGETADELCGVVRAMREAALPFPVDRDGLVDNCGTGGDGRGTFNVSTVSAIVAAAAGCKIAKHCNRAVSGRCGSADLFEALGIRADGSADFPAQTLDAAGLAILFAPRFHPLLSAVADIRRQLRFRTIFNLAGPLANPACVRRQVVGVFAASMTRVMAESLRRLGSVHALVVHSEDGQDEISPCGVTHVCELRDGQITEWDFTPESVQFARSELGALQADNVADSARLANEVLRGVRSPCRDAVLLNAGATVYVAGRANSIAEGVERAACAIDSGAAMDILNMLQRLSREQN